MKVTIRDRISVFIIPSWVTNMLEKVIYRTGKKVCVYHGSYDMPPEYDIEIKGIGLYANKLRNLLFRIRDKIEGDCDIPF